MSVKIIADSACDLPREIIEEYDVKALPLRVTIDDQEFKEWEEIKPIEVYDGMREGKVYKTAQVPLIEFQELFTSYAQEKQSCFYIAFSSELSGTYQAAVMAKNQVSEEYPEAEIEILDGKCASLGYGLVVYYAVMMAAEGMGMKEIIEKTEFNARHMEHIFTVDNLDYLYRGGRLSKSAAFVGGILNIKPILDVEDGKLIPIEKKKGRKRVLKRIIELMEERGVDLENQLIGISHSDDEEGALKLKEMIKERFGAKEFMIHTIGGVIGAHVGPGTLALFFLNQREG
ncbi:MAG TPA: DegV family protein [Halanaerobiales bacterium]|nr:DegV family protein [Halanaerobiales bacterium]